MPIKYVANAAYDFGRACRMAWACLKGLAIGGFLLLIFVACWPVALALIVSFFAYLMIDGQRAANDSVLKNVFGTNYTAK